MTSAGLLTLIRGAASRMLPEGTLDIASADKPTLLEALRKAHGYSAVFGAGLMLKNFGEHPVITALLGGDTPVDILERWMLLERFGHTRNRTRITETSLSPHEASLSVHHFAVDGGNIDALDDFFVWGIFVALLVRAGFEDISASLSASLAETNQDFCLFQGGITQPFAGSPQNTATLKISWNPSTRQPIDFDMAKEVGPAMSKTNSLVSLVEKDLVRSWRLNEAARALHTSTRNLQRSLREESTTFSETLQRSRVDAAQRLMRDRRLSLTEIAFCVGFSDLAHFSRIFRRYLDVPPSAYRDLIDASEGSAT